VVVSDTLHRGDESGYGLVVTRHRIFGAKKTDSLPNFGAYLGTGTSLTESARREAETMAEKIVAAKDLEISVSSIGQVLFRRPSLFFGGYAIIKTADRAVRLDTSVLYVDPELTETSRVMEASLSSVLGWRLSEGEPWLL
jgi:hypothetical protein